MCGIGGIFNYSYGKYNNIKNELLEINRLQKHRGPDADGIFISNGNYVGLSHVRLSIIDLNTGQQPMEDDEGNCIVFNGEIYNYIELKERLKYNYKTTSDTEVVLVYYKKYGKDCLEYFNGMFSFVIWDNNKKTLFGARDRFGIKPFYYINKDDTFYFASEVKAISRFIEKNINLDALKDYFVFQFTLDDKTLFKDVHQLMPAHYMIVNGDGVNIKKYWDIQYNIDYDHTKKYFVDNIRDLINDTVKLNLRSDVEVGCYLSGGIDSSVVSSVSSNYNKNLKVFNGRFDEGVNFDETEYVKELCNRYGMDLHQLTITSDDFINNIEKVTYHMDYPVAGPGSFNQYMISSLASEKVKVVLGGQGGDEIFGGYARYLLAYFEQCIKGAIDNTMDSGNFIVTYESIIPNLTILNKYKPLMKEFWADGLFDDKDKRYFRLINRANTMGDIIDWDLLDGYSSFSVFQNIFGSNNVNKESYFDSMLHFDFKTLLPALLHVEDRMSMAHGLESRVPFLDHKLIEFVSNIPSNIKFENGNLKHLLKESSMDILPIKILNRKDKMGFPIPLNKWAKKDMREFIGDILGSQKAKNRFYFSTKINIDDILDNNLYGRNLWGLLSLELWQKQFIDE